MGINILKLRKKMRMIYKKNIKNYFSIILFLLISCISKYQINRFIPNNSIYLSLENIKIDLYIVNYNFYQKSDINDHSYLIKVTFRDTLQNLSKKKVVPKDVIIDSCWINFNDFNLKQYISFNKKNRYVYDSGKIIEYNTVFDIPVDINEFYFNILISILNDFNNISDSKTFNFKIIKISEKKYKVQPVPDI